MELYHHNRQEVVKANGSSSREESDLRRKQINEFQRESERVTVPESALEIFVRVNGVEPRWSRYLDGFLGEWASEIHENKVNAALSRLGFPNLPSFSGVNPYDWVKICEEFFDINPSLEVCKESLVADLLIGKAKAWYWSWCVGNKEADWDEFVDDLCEHFGNKEQLDNVESSVVKKLSDFEEESQVGLKEETDLGCKVNEQEVAFDGILLVKSNSCILVEGLCEIEAVANKESDLEKHDVLESESNKEFVENFSECEGENQDGFEENFCDSRLESRVRWDRFEEVHGKEDDSVKLWSSNEMGEYGQYRGRPPDSFFRKGHNEVDDSGLVRPEVIKKICPEVKDGCKDQVFCEFGRENLVGMKNNTDLECDVSELVIQDVVVKAALGSNSSLDVDVDLEYFDVKSKPPDNFGATKEMKLSCLGGDNLVIVLAILETFRVVTIAAGSTFQLGSEISSPTIGGGNDVFDALQFTIVDKKDRMFKLLVENWDALMGASLRDMVKLLVEGSADDLNIDVIERLRAIVLSKKEELLILDFPDSRGMQVDNTFEAELHFSHWQLSSWKDRPPNEQWAKQDSQEHNCVCYVHVLLSLNMVQGALLLQMMNIRLIGSKTRDDITRKHTRIAATTLQFIAEATLQLDRLGTKWTCVDRSQLQSLVILVTTCLQLTVRGVAGRLIGAEMVFFLWLHKLFDQRIMNSALGCRYYVFEVP